MAANLNNFVNTLKEDINALHALEEILDSERSSLEQNKVEELDTLTTKKVPLLQQIEKNSRIRKECLAETRLPKERFLNLLEQKAPPVMALYRQCESALKTVKKKNDVNAQILVNSQKRVLKLMSIIRGQSSQSHIYGKNGGEKAVTSNHILGEA